MLDSPDPPAVRPIVARLVRDTPLTDGAAECQARVHVYRPLVVGAAILREPLERGDPWRVTLEAGPRVRPRAPASRAALHTQVDALRMAGVACRVAAALVAPEDMVSDPRAMDREQAIRRTGRCRSEFYGWSLLYHAPGMPRIGFVEPHPTFRHLPSFFDSPLEVIDRSEFLARHGVRSRPLALLTQPEDFDRAADGTLVNRYVPHGTLRRPSRLGWLP
ncbi:MAG: hypothetical protein EBS51_05450 [Planctomycetia bacterium]|nr:hypothetical protein [Planctomycetia bacterium]